MLQTLQSSLFASYRQGYFCVAVWVYCVAEVFFRFIPVVSLIFRTETCNAFGL